MVYILFALVFIRHAFVYDNCETAKYFQKQFVSVENIIFHEIIFHESRIMHVTYLQTVINTYVRTFFILNVLYVNYNLNILCVRFIKFELLNFQ